MLGQLEIPIKVGIVGGPLQPNPTVGMNLRLLGVSSARELAEVIGAVGLAKNFSAIRALVTESIQQGHMTLHARSVVAAADATPKIFETVVDRPIESAEVKIWKAREAHPELHESIFDQIDSLVIEGVDVDALVGHKLETLGELMNICQGLLNLI